MQVPAPPGGDALDRLAHHAGQLFRARRDDCAPAVLVTINQFLDLGHDPELLRDLSAGMVGGMGNAGCACGALNGAVMALGLALGQGKATARAANRLHGLFQEQWGHTCCRILKKKDRQAETSHAEQCARRTETGARLAAQIILELRPDLAVTLDVEPPARPALWRRLLRR